VIKKISKERGERGKLGARVGEKVIMEEVGAGRYPTKKKRGRDGRKGRCRGFFGEVPRYRQKVEGKKVGKSEPRLSVTCLGA